MVAIGITSCNNAEETCDNGVMDGTETGVDCGGDCDACPPYTLMIDGSAVTPTAVTATITYDFYTENNGTPIYGQTISVQYVIGFSQIITISYSNDDPDANGLLPGVYHTSVPEAVAANPFAHVLGSYLDISGQGEFFYSNHVSQDQTATLSASNPTTQKVSGSFDIIIKNDPQSPNSQSMTISGSFSDLSYTE